MSEEPEQSASFVERHLQTMIMAALGAVCAWMAMTTQGLTVSVATLTEKVSNLQAQISEQGDNNFESEIADLKARVFVLEKSLDAN
jgi:hypothetical protein